MKTLMNGTDEIVLDNNKIRWTNSDIQKKERTSADNELGGKKLAENAHLSYYVYFNKIKKEYERTNLCVLRGLCYMPHNDATR